MIEAALILSMMVLALVPIVLWSRMMQHELREARELGRRFYYDNQALVESLVRKHGETVYFREEPIVKASDLEAPDFRSNIPPPYFQSKNEVFADPKKK